jgi:hypothetical protein
VPHLAINIQTNKDIITGQEPLGKDGGGGAVNYKKMFAEEFHADNNLDTSLEKNLSIADIFCTNFCVLCY